MLKRLLSNLILFKDSSLYLIHNKLKQVHSNRTSSSNSKYSKISSISNKSTSPLNLN